MNTKLKHTPGPWTVVLRTPDRQIGESAFQCYSVDTVDGTTISECGAGEANARLIAAAPELLSALKLCLEELERHKARGHGISELALGLAMQAIAKAEGKGTTT